MCTNFHFSFIIIISFIPREFFDLLMTWGEIPFNVLIGTSDCSGLKRETVQDD